MDNKADKRKIIVDAADSLFEKFGPIRTSLADIARKADMSPPNIYNFFASKDAIMEAVGERHLSELRRNLLAEIALIDSRWDAICQLFLSTTRDMRLRLGNEKDILQMQAVSKANKWQFVQIFHDFLVRTIETLIASGVASGEFGKVDVQETAKGIFDCMTNAWDPLVVLKFAPESHERDLQRQLSLLKRALR